MKSMRLVRVKIPSNKALTDRRSAPAAQRHDIGRTSEGIVMEQRWVGCLGTPKSCLTAEAVCFAASAQFVGALRGLIPRRVRYALFQHTKTEP